MRSAGDINGCDASFLLDEVLGLVMDQEVMYEDFEFFSKNIVIGFSISSKPLVSHFMLDQYSVINSDGLAGHFKPDVWIRVFENPRSVEVLFHHENSFLEPGDFTVSVDGDRLAVQVNGSVKQQGVDSDPDLLTIMDDVVLEAIIKVDSFKDED